MKILSLALGIFLALASITIHATPPSPGGNESPEMQSLLASFNLPAEQRAKYDAARAETGKQMREIHEGKINGTLPQEKVLKRALASHRAFNAAVKEILTPEQYLKWEPLREADHHKIAQAHKERDAAKSADPAPKP